MSKIISLVKQGLPGQVIRVNELVSTLTTSGPRMWQSDGRRWAIDVKIGAEYAIYPHSNLNEILKEVRRCLAEQVFGEYRVPMIKCIIDAHNAGEDDLARRLKSILESMFNDEPYRAP